MSQDLDAAGAFAESVAGVVARHLPAPGRWEPGRIASDNEPELAGALKEIGWNALSGEPDLVGCAGLGAVELGLRLASIRHVDRLLGAAPVAGELVRCRLPGGVVILDEGCLVRHPEAELEPCPAVGGLAMHRVRDLGPARDAAEADSRAAVTAWLAAGVGYLAGLGEGALAMTLDYVRRRRAFGTPLAALAPVQQRLASAATAVRGVRLLAARATGPDALAHAGAAVIQACADCHQVTGAIGFTLEHPLHRFSQRARALATFNDALLDAGLQARVLTPLRPLS